jgi:2-dehydro-3-deoxygluconokinase
MAIDVLSFGETMLRLTAPGGVRLETTPVLQVYVGGTESNTLSCLARLGLHVAWMSALPSTPIGRHVETELRSHGVDTRHIVWAGSTARLGTFYAEEAVNPLGLQVHYDRANSACALVDPDAVNYKLVDTAKMLHLTGITPGIGEGAREVFRRLLARAREQKVTAPSSGRLPRQQRASRRHASRRVFCSVRAPMPPNSGALRERLKRSCGRWPGALLEKRKRSC